MLDFLNVLFVLFMTLQGLAFIVYLFLCMIWIKPFFLRIKATEGEIVYNDEQGDMGGSASFMGPFALLCLVFFYRPIFYHKTAKKIEKLYQTGNTKLTDLFGIWLPIGLFVLAVLLVYFFFPDEYNALGKILPFLLPILASEITSMFLLIHYAKKNYYVPDKRIND